MTHPFALGAVEVHGAAYVQPNPQYGELNSSGRMNVYVLWFTDATTASGAVTSLRRQLADCRAHPDLQFTVTAYNVDDFVMEQAYPEIEQLFVGELVRHQTTVGPAAGLKAYSLAVARAGKLVVAFESLNGWSDRLPNTVGLLMNQALDAASP